MIVQNSLQKKSESFRTWETKQKWIWCYMHWFLIDFCLWSRTRAVHIVQFLTEHFNERVFSSILSPHSQVILHAGLARSCRIHCLMNARETFSPGKGCSIWRMRGDGKSSSSELIQRLQWSTLSRGARVIFRWWILQLHPIVDSSVKTVSSKIR